MTPNIPCKTLRWIHWWWVGSWHLVGSGLGGSSSVPPAAAGQTVGCWGPKACLAKHQVLWGTFSKLVINFHFNCITLLLAEMGVGAAFLREEMLCCLVSQEQWWQLLGATRGVLHAQQPGCGGAFLESAVRGLCPLGWRRAAFLSPVFRSSSFWVAPSLSVGVGSQRHSCNALECYTQPRRIRKDLSVLDGIDWGSVGFLPASQLESRKSRLRHFLRV